MLARDCDLFVTKSCRKHLVNVTSGAWEETKAVRAGCTCAMERNAGDVIVEGDCANVMNRLNNNKEDITTLGFIIKEIKNLNSHFHKISFKWSVRSCNKTTDCLSEIPIRKQCNYNFDMDYPMEIHDFVISDSW